jgi:hypothetical protein
MVVFEVILIPSMLLDGILFNLHKFDINDFAASGFYRFTAGSIQSHSIRTCCWQALSALQDSG